MRTFTNGDDVCAGCGRCCRNVIGLEVTDEELERVPEMKEHVTGRRGPWQVVDMPGGCPYQLDDGRCGVYEKRPFDCSLYPVHVSQTRLVGPSGVKVTWRYGGSECPQLVRFRKIGVSDAQLDSLRDWSARSFGVATAELEFQRSRPRAVAVSVAAVRRWRHGEGA